MITRTIKNALRRHVFSADGDEFVSRFSRFNRLHWHLPLELSWQPERNAYVVASDGETIAFARKERVWMYSGGIRARVDELARIYFLQQVPIRPGDVIVDCGANIGEVSRSARQRGADVIAVEPEQGEARCITHNVPGVRAVLNKALWKEDGYIEFFSKNDSGDSSIFEMEQYQSKKRVPTTTLDTVFHEQGIDRLRLLKLEAEGAEPEILEGARDSLTRIDYITADLGPERGVRKETTLAPVANRLYAEGFELVDVYHRRMICLFRNKRAAAH
jgi:FkbM family methyltransferase